MLLTVYTLPQLAVSAKLLCLLMVVICGAVPSMVRSVRLYNDCSCSEVRIDDQGRALANDDQSDLFHNLTISSLDFSVKLSIFAEDSKRYLCFNKRWKLVGLKKFGGSMCQFYETITGNGYSRYRSVAKASQFVGFNRRGRPLRGELAVENGVRDKCLNFIKYDSRFNVNAHNDKISGAAGNQPQPQGRSNTQLVKNTNHTNNRNKQHGKLRKKEPVVRIRHRNHHSAITRKPS